jgi:hypothetical protein
MLPRFLDALEFFPTNSGSLLPNSTALVKTILTGQLSLELKIETDKDSLRRFGELLTLP